MSRNTFEPEDPEEEMEEDTPLPIPELIDIDDLKMAMTRPGKEEFLETLEVWQIEKGYSVTRQHTIDRIKRELGFNYPK